LHGSVTHEDGIAPDPYLIAGTDLARIGGRDAAVWAVYAFLPLLLIPAAIGAQAALNNTAPNGMRAALVFATIGAVSMLLGLARWPSVHWELARAYPTAPAEAQASMDAVFLGLNVYLGNYIGEFIGEVALNAFFVLVGFAALQSPATKRWFGIGGLVVGTIGWVAAFRNITSAVTPIAEVNNYLLPLWLIVLGVVLIRWRASPAGATR
jgi:hypothetical protein